MAGSTSLAEEKEKIGYEHRLTVQRIVIEKVLLGVVVALFAFLASLMLESFRSRLTQERFELEKRLEGVQHIGTAHSRLMDLAYECGREEDPVPDELLGRYSNAINEFTRVTNQWHTVFDASFDRSMKYHVWVHDGIATGKIELKKDHWPFMLAASDNFRFTLKKALDIDTAAELDSPAFVFSEVDTALMGKITGEEFFDIQYKKWQAENQ